MFNAKEIRAIATVSEPVLTAYLNTQDRTASVHPQVPVCLAWFRKQAASLSQTLPAPSAQKLQQQVARVERFLDGRHPEEKALVLFAGRETWRVLPLYASVTNELHWGAPSIGQLFRLLNQSDSYGVVVVDHQAARVFHYVLGEFNQLIQWRLKIDESQWKRKDVGPVSRERRQTLRGSNRDVFEHRLQEQYDRLYREIAENTVALLQQHNFAALFLVGSERLIGPIERNLRPATRERIVRVTANFGKFSMAKILRRLESLIADYHLNRQLADVEQLFAAARGTVTDADEALATLQDGALRTILVASDIRFPLRECTNCGLVNRSADPACPNCRGARRDVDLWDVLPELAAVHGTRVEFVGGKAARILTQAGGLAGWLRPAHQRAAS